MFTNRGEIAGKPQTHTLYAVFHSFFSGDSKQDATTTIAHIKYIIELLKQRNIMSNMLITTWERMDGCDEQYRCSTELYRMSIMSQAFSVIINRSISAPGHGREVVDGLNSIEKRFLF